MDTASAPNPFAAPGVSSAAERAPGEPIYAGFWWRVLASLIDGLVLAPLIVVNYLNSAWWHQVLLALPLIIVAPLYKTLLEVRGATLGKMACGIRIIGADGRPPGRRAVLRNILSLVSLAIELPLLAAAPRLFITEDADMDTLHIVWLGAGGVIGVLWLVCVLFVPFHGQKRGLHDLWAGTWCVRPGRRPA